MLCSSIHPTLQAISGFCLLCYVMCPSLTSVTKQPNLSTSEITQLFGKDTRTRTQGFSSFALPRPVRRVSGVCQAHVLERF